MSDEENSKDATDKDDDKTSEIKELTSRENYVLRARQWCTTVREKTKGRGKLQHLQIPLTREPRTKKRTREASTGVHFRVKESTKRPDQKQVWGNPN